MYVRMCMYASMCWRDNPSEFFLSVATVEKTGTTVLQILVPLKVLTHFSRDTIYRNNTRCYFKKTIRDVGINQLLYRPGWIRRAIALARNCTRHIKNTRDMSHVLNILRCAFPFILIH